MILLSTYTEAAKTIIPVKYVPEITMVLPFQPLLYTKSTLEHQLKDALAKVESQLMATYPMQQAMPVFIRLQQIINSLNFYTHKKSVAIFTSPIMEKVMYLNFEVEENILVDSPFKLSDIARIKRETKQFLLLNLSKDLSQLYMGNPAGLHLIMQNTPVGRSHKSTPFITDIRSFNHFLSKVDRSLSILLRSHPYPVFIVADDNMIDWYKSITNNDEHISRCLQKPHPYPDEEMLLTLIKPYFVNWQQITNQKLMRVLAKAQQQKKLVCGIADVHNAVKEKGCVLVAEEGRSYPDIDVSRGSSVSVNRSINRPFYLQDPVDEIAEKVLESGGDIELLPYGSLAKYQQIAYVKPQ
jgi:hypothetical protein